MNGRNVDSELREFFGRVATPEPSAHLRRAVAAARVESPARQWPELRIPRLAFSAMGLAATVVLAAGLVIIVANRGAFGGPAGAGASGSGGATQSFGASAGSFIPTTSMTAARTGATATLLADGRVLIAGGSAQLFGPPPASAELYDPGTGKFQATGDMTIGRSGHTATLLSDGRVLIIGGNGGISAEVYSPATGTFSATGSMRANREHYTATLLSDGRVLVTGGDDMSDGSAPLASAELYDPTTGAFSPTGSMTTPRVFQSATMLADGRVLIAGGIPYDSSGQIVGNGPSRTALIFDPKTGTFSTTGSMAFMTEFYTATLLLDGRILFAGGDAGSQSLASAQVYDPATGNFSQTGSMAIGREGHTATLLPEGRVLIAGGEQAGNVGGNGSASAELYQP